VPKAKEVCVIYIHVVNNVCACCYKKLVTYIMSYLLQNGHDYRVFVMAYIDFLSFKADGFHFDQDCVLKYRDKSLLSFIQGNVAHIPQHLRGRSLICLIFSYLQPGLHNWLVLGC